jgi:gamma-polyglutamate synthase
VIEQAVFEVFRAESEGEWNWRLQDGDLPIATSISFFGTSQTARAAIDQARAAVAVLTDHEMMVFDNQPATAGTTEPKLRVRSREGGYEWLLLDGETVLAIPSGLYSTRADAREAAQEFLEHALGSVPIYLVRSEEPTDRDQTPFEVGVGPLSKTVRSLLKRGQAHRRFLDSIETRIIVAGIRGKSSTTRHLDDVFNRRGYDTLTKITGNHPTIIHNGEVIPLERTGPRVTLYENVRVFREFVPQLDAYSPDDVAIFENQAITEYTTRMINELFVKPHVVILTNVRQDHQDTLGRTRGELARSFARSVPKGTHVISGEQHPVLHEYMHREIEQRNGTLTQVSIPERHQGLIGAETMHAVNETLRFLELDPLPAAELEAYLDSIQPEWEHLDGGRVFNAAEVNDIESTEAVRQALAGDDLVVPFVYLRADRRSRTASFVDYLNTLAERDLIARAHVAGAFIDVFASRVEVPVVQHDDSEDPRAVLDGLLAEGPPVVLMGNTVASFMRALEEAIAEEAGQVDEMEVLADD